MQDLLSLFASPGILVVSALLGLVVVPPCARFFDLGIDQLKEELRLDDELQRQLLLFGLVPRGPYIYFRIIGLVGSYLAVVLLIYGVITRVKGWFR